MVKKLSTFKKSLIKDSALSATNLAGGIAGLILSTNPIFTFIAGVTMAVTGVWVFYGVKAIKAIVKKRHEPTPILKESRKTHKLRFKQAKKDRAKLIGKEEKEFEPKIYKDKGVDEARKEYLKRKRAHETKKRIQEAKKEYKQLKTDADADIDKEKKRVKAEELAERSVDIAPYAQITSMPKTKKIYGHAKRLAVTLAVFASALTLVAGVQLANNYISANANANEVNGAQHEYLDVESTKNNFAGVELAVVNILNAGFAIGMASKMRLRSQNQFIAEVERKKELIGEPEGETE